MIQFETAYFPFKHCPLVVIQKVHWSINQLRILIALSKLVLNRIQTGFSHLELFRIAFGCQGPADVPQGCHVLPFLSQDGGSKEFRTMVVNGSYVEGDQGFM